MSGQSGWWWGLLALGSGCERDVIFFDGGVGTGPEPVPADANEPILESPVPEPAEHVPGQTPAAVICSNASCEPALVAFEPNDPYRQHRSLRGDTRQAQNGRSASECASQGPDLAYELDLRAFAEPVVAYIEVRGEFNASLAIETGPTEDPFVVTCNESHSAGAREAFLAITLEPSLYRVVVDGDTAEDAGEFELVVELPAPGARCSAPPANDRCDQAIVIDPARSVQTFFGTTDCASDQAQANWECSDFANREVEVFYSLDLSERTQPVLVYATTALAPTNHDTRLFVARDAGGICAETLLCDSSSGETAVELWAALEPGRYLLGVEAGGDTGDFGLSVEIASEPCLVANDTCQTAQVIEPVAGLQTFTAWPGCGDDSMINDCGLDPSPDIFYRLDLRGFNERVRVRARADRGEFDYDDLALLADGGGTCGDVLRCGNFDLWLEPKIYYLALDGFRDQQGPVDFSVEIGVDNPPPPPVDCIDESVALCAKADLSYCCSGDGDVCSLTWTSCGLRPEALACLCQADPRCCDGPGRYFGCATLLLECGTFCDGFDPALTCPV